MTEGDHDASWSFLIYIIMSLYHAVEQLQLLGPFATPFALALLFGVSKDGEVGWKNLFLYNYT